MKPIFGSEHNNCDNGTETEMNLNLHQCCGCITVKTFCCHSNSKRMCPPPQQWQTLADQKETHLSYRFDERHEQLLVASIGIITLEQSRSLARIATINKRASKPFESARTWTLIDKFEAKNHTRTQFNYHSLMRLARRLYRVGATRAINQQFASQFAFGETITISAPKCSASLLWTLAARPKAWPHRTIVGVVTSLALSA